MIKNQRGDGAGPPYPDADGSPTPERPGSKYITPLSLSLWPHPIQNRDPASREGWQCEEGQKYLYLWLTVQGAGGIHCQNPKKIVTFVKVSWSIKSHDQQFMKWRSTVMLHIWNTHGHWAFGKKTNWRGFSRQNFRDQKVHAPLEYWENLKTSR